MSDDGHDSPKGADLTTDRDSAGEEDILEPRFAPRGLFSPASPGGGGSGFHLFRTSSNSPRESSLLGWPSNTNTTLRGAGAATLSEPTDWWGSRDATRPWRERPEPKRRRTIPPEQEDRWLRTKERVFKALDSVKEYAPPAAHDALEMGTELLRFAPVAGLAEAARVLLTIWNSLQLVETNRLACLRLTERCADILLAVYQEIQEADDSGGRVGEELAAPLMKLTESFKAVHVLLQKQVHRPFLKRYLKRDDILRSVNGCDAALSDALGMFSMSIQIRTLRQLQAVEAHRRADTERLIATLNSRSPIDPEATPRGHLIELPPTEPHSEHAATSSSGTSSSSSSNGKPKTSGTSSSGATQERVLSPPPTPDSINAHPGPSEATIHPPPSPSDIREQLAAIVNRQNSIDHALDMEDLRALMRSALATSSDAEMIRVLQVKREEMPEALKTLQRALEKEREKLEESEDMELEDEGVGTDDIAVDATSGVPGGFAVGTIPPESTTVKGTSTGASVATGRLTTLKRRLTDASTRTRSSRTSSKKSQGDGKGSGWSGPCTDRERDTLDREFIESGIDALRRLSRGQELNLPSWTITRYEVDMEEKIGIGYFSDVYKAVWRHHTVAVKVLAPTTPQKLFLHEMAVWKTIDNPHVLPLLGASSATGDPPWFLVSPYMKNGNLVSYLRNLKKSAEGTVERRMVYEIAKGMEYLHKMGVIHGDLKGTNVLINDDGHCVISDFGQSEMKNEAYRLSGTPLPHGTLRWQAPEIIDGQSTAHLTQQADVYAFAILCIEILTHGSLPWPNIDDETVRYHVLEENKRPPLPVSKLTKDLSPVIEACWVRDPAARPTFSNIVRDLKKKGMSKYVDPPSMRSSKLFDDEYLKRTSPDIRPGDLPDVRDPSSSSSSPGTSSPSLLQGKLSPATIPLQRIITPIREEERVAESNGASPVDYKPINIPGPAPTMHDDDVRLSLVANVGKSDTTKKGSVTHDGSSPSDSTPSTRTASTDVKTDSSAADAPGPGLQLSRFQSPPPMDEIIAQRRNERRYRLLLQHDYNSSLKLPLWEPSPVEVGAVGYLSRPSGQFITLFNSYNPVKTSDGRAEGMPSLYGYNGYGSVAKGNQRQDRRNAAQRGLDVIQGLLWFRSRASGDFQQSVSRRVSFPLRAGQKNAYLYAETTMYRYVLDIAAPKAWFSANIGRILDIYGAEHRLQKEDVYLIVGALNTPDYALFVNHNNPDGQVHFNVFAGAKAGSKWGTFSIDTDSTASATGGPIYHEDVPGQHSSANKVSDVAPSKPWNTVLLARLRFRPDDDHPTSL